SSASCTPGVNAAPAPPSLPNDGTAASARRPSAPSSSSHQVAGAEVSCVPLVATESGGNPAGSRQTPPSLSQRSPREPGAARGAGQRPTAPGAAANSSPAAPPDPQHVLVDEARTRERVARLGERGRQAGAERRLPCRPRPAPVPLAERPEERVVVEPRGFRGAEATESLGARRPALPFGRHKACEGDLERAPLPR